MRLAVVAFCLGLAWLQWQATLPPARWAWLLPLASCVLLIPRPAPLLLQWARSVLWAGFFVLLGVAYAAWRADLRLADRLPAHWQGVDIKFVGVVTDLPRADGRAERARFDIEQVLTPGAPRLERVLLARYFPRDAATPIFNAGERWQLTARLKRPHGTHNPHGFDFSAWALENGIAATGTVRANPRRLAARAGTAHAVIAALRASIRTRILATLGAEPAAGVIVALAVGDQRSIPNAQWRSFTRTGVNHLLSISGLHVTLIASLAGWLVASVWRRVPRAVRWRPARQAGLAAAVVAAFAYALLAGFEVPAQRTLFMFAALAVAFWGRREAQPFTALTWALFVVLLLDPWAVLSAGFWLSFGAMAVLVWVTLGRAGPAAKWHGWVTAQLAVTLALAPALLLLFQQVSLISPLANAIAIPLVSAVVTPLTLLGVIAPPLWQLAAALMTGLTHALEWAANLPWAVATCPAPTPWALAFALLGTLWILMPRGFPLRALGLVLWLPIGLPALDPPAPGALIVDVIDVGQGTAILLRTHHRALLYDTGPGYGDSDAGARTVVPFLRALGVRHLDGLIVSHDDSDHTGGLTSVLREVHAGWLLHSLPAASPLLAGTPTSRRCARGQVWQWDGVRFEILNPQSRHRFEARRRDNDFSCVLQVTSRYGTLLVTGDAERRGELELLESGRPLAADVLVAGHHGSRTSSIPEFVSAVAPRHVIFTVGYRNPHGHPASAVVARFRDAGSQRWRSDTQGALRFAFSQTGIATQATLPGHRRYWQARE